MIHKPPFPIKLDKIWTIDGDYPYNYSSIPNYVSNWRYPQEREKYYADLKAGLDIPYSSTDIVYKNNRHGFRTIEFDKIPTDVYKILCLGCSHTEGIGLPEHHSWPLILESLIKNHGRKNALVLNLGVGGTSNIGIAVRGVHAINTLKPDIIFTQWSYLLRTTYIDADGFIQDWGSPEPEQVDDKELSQSLRFKYYEYMSNDYNDLHQFMISYTMLNQAARLAKVPICNNVTMLRADLKIFDWIKDRIQDPNIAIYDKYPQERARDLLHPGYQYNVGFANSMFDWFKKLSSS